MKFRLWSRRKRKTESKKMSGEWVMFDDSDADQEVAILFALFTETGNYLSLNPHTDEFFEVGSVSMLKIWDYQTYSNPDIWFMGNNPRPKVAYSIRRIPPSEVQKLG